MADILYTDGALRELGALPKRIADQILRKVERLRSGLIGDVKALRGTGPGFRLWSGDYRILFDVRSDTVVVHRIKHRREAYE